MAQRHGWLAVSFSQGNNLKHGPMPVQRMCMEVYLSDSFRSVVAATLNTNLLEILSSGGWWDPSH